jgi:translation initiation factor 2 alpha subunit (eIF-2alpha)
MSNWILLIGLIVIELTIIAVGIVVCRKIEEYFGEVLPVYKEMTGCYEKIMYNIEGKFDNLHEIFKAQKALTEEELKSYNVMTDYMKNLGDMHKELLQCWRGIEDRYSDTYEQFSELNERMQKFEVDVPQNVIDQIVDRVKEQTIHVDTGIISDFISASKFRQATDIPAVENPYEIQAKGEYE